MAQPPAYNRDADFTKNHGSSVQNDTLLNAELDDVSTSINAIRENLAMIQDDDGALKEGIVTKDNLTQQAYEDLVDDVVAQVNPQIETIQALADSAEQAAQSAAASATAARQDADAAAQSASDAAGSASTSEQTVINIQNTLPTQIDTYVTSLDLPQQIEDEVQQQLTDLAVDDRLNQNLEQVQEGLAQIPQQVENAVTAQDIPGQVEDEVDAKLTAAIVEGLEEVLGYTPADDADLSAEVTARQNADAALQTAVDGKISKSGGTMTGELNIVANYDVNDSNVQHIASTNFTMKRRSCYVGMSGGQIASPWFKVGTYTTTSASSTTAVCLFDVASTNYQYQRGGQLRVVFRLNANRVIDSANTKLEWVTTYGDLNPDDFVLVFNSDSSSSTLDLYVRCNKGDLRYTFKVLSEKTLLSGNSNAQAVFFNLANNVSNGSLASLPSGTQIKSKFRSKAKCGKRIVFTADFKCPDYDELMSKTYQQGATNRYIWPQAANHFVKNGVEYLFVLLGASTDGNGTGTVTQVVTVYNLDTGEYLGYWLLPNVPTTEGLVIKTESDGDYIYTAKGGNTLQKFKFTLGTYKTTLTGIDVVDPDGNLVPVVWFLSYLNGTWCIDGITNRIGGFTSRTLFFYDDNFKRICQYDVQKYEQDVWNSYEGLTAEQQKVQWSIPRTQAISIGTDGVYFYKGGGTNAADTTFPITDCGVDHFNFQGDLVRSSVCRHTPFAARMLSLLGVSSNINHTECEGGYCTDDGRCFWFAVVGVQSGKIVLMEEFSDAPDAVDFSDCLANRQSNIPFQSNTPHFPRTSGGYRNPWTGELIGSLDEFIKMCAIWGLDNVFISNYSAGLGTTIASTTVASAENFGIFVRRYSYNRFFVEVIKNALDMPGTYVVGVDSDFNVTSCTIQREKLYALTLGSTSFSPATNGGASLGTASLKWSEVFSNTATINTSDYRLKDNISDIDDAVLDAWELVSLKVFQFKDAIERKGDDARIHTGVIAQQVQRAFEAKGLDAFRYGLLCYDAWEAKDAVLDEDGNEIESAQEAGDRYSIRYEEALILEAAYQRRRADRIESRLKAIEERMA